MLRVTLDLVPFGIEEQTKTLGMLEIARTTLHDDPEDYRVTVFGEDGALENIFTLRRHYYEDGAWALVTRATKLLSNPETY